MCGSSIHQMIENKVSNTDIIINYEEGAKQIDIKIMKEILKPKSYAIQRVNA